MTDGQNTYLHEMTDSAYARQTPTYWNSNAPRSSDVYSVVPTTPAGDALLKRICDQSKLGPNSTVYTIGFELDGEPEAKAALLDCASDAGTHYLVNGVEISTAFQNIADEIVTLKLTN